MDIRKKHKAFPMFCPILRGVIELFNYRPNNKLMLLAILFSYVLVNRLVNTNQIKSAVLCLCLYGTLTIQNTKLFYGFSSFLLRFY